jgi:hypothetical protein
MPNAADFLDAPSASSFLDEPEPKPAASSFLDDSEPAPSQSERDKRRKLLELERDALQLNRGNNDILESVIGGAEAALGVVNKMNPIVAASEFVRGAQGLVTGMSSPEVTPQTPLVPVGDIGQIAKQTANALGYSGKGQEIAAGIGDAGKSLVEFMVTPDGVATMGAGLGPKTAQVMLHSAFATDMASHVPEAAQSAGEASVTGTPREAAQTAAQAIFTTAAPAMIVAGSLRKTQTEVIADSGAPLTAKVLEETSSREVPSSRLNEQVKIREQSPSQEPAKSVTAEAPKSLEQQPVIPAKEPAKTAPAPAFTKGMEVDTQYGPAKVVVQRGNRVQVDYGDGSKFSLKASDIKAKGEPAVAPEPLKVVPGPKTAIVEAKPIEAPEPILPGPAESRLGIASVPDFVKDFPATVQKWMTAEGNLPKEVHKNWISSRSEIASEGRSIAYNTRDLHRALAENHGITNWRKLTRGMEDVPAAVTEQINKVLRGEADPMTLPANVRAPVESMRSHIDGLSKTLIDKGLVDSELQAKIGDNLGVYLARSYRIFDDPKYVKNIPANVLNDARRFIHQGLVKVDPRATLEMADAKMREMLADWSESGFDKQLRGGKLGSKDLTQFMARKDIAPEIRALLGEYKDPVVNYARSVTKIARFIADQEFLNEVKRLGRDKFLFEEGKAPKGFEYQIAAEGSSTMAPLNGLRTSKAIKEAFENFNKGEVADNVVWKTWLKLTAISKTAKTVGSVMTQARNLIGQPLFNLASGHFDPRPYKTANKAILTDIGAGDSPAWRQYYQKMTKLGVVNESAPAAELRASLRDAGMKDFDPITDPSSKALTRLLRAGINAPIRLYQISDEIGKIVGFENERARLGKAFPSMEPGKLDAMTAERIRNTYPTYSLVPELIKKFRRQPLIGPFVSFASEIFRTSYHNLRYAMEDMRSGNAELQKAGAQRLAGMMGVLSLGYIVSNMTQAMFGIDEQTDEDIRRFLPRWSKNSQLVFTGKDEETGEYSYINWSYQNPYSYLTDSTVAVLSGGDDKTLRDKIVEAAVEMVRPFASEQMLTAAAVDAMRNQTQTGRQIYNPEDPAWIQKVMVHLFEAVEPGTTSRLRKKIIPSLQDKQPDYGRKLDPSTEITAEITGIRSEKFNFEQAIQYKVREFNKRESDAEYIFNSAAHKQGTVTPEEVFAEYQKADAARFKIWQGFHNDITAALRNGVSQKSIQQFLGINHISGDNGAALIKGKYIPQNLSEQAIGRLKKNGRGDALDLIQNYRRQVNGKPLNESDTKPGPEQ